MHTTSHTKPDPSLVHRARPGIIRTTVARLTAVPPWVLLIQLFIGLGWTRAGVEKLISSEWWDGTELDAFLGEHTEQTVSWYQPVIDLVVAPGVIVISFVVMTLQFLLGAALVTNKHVGIALGVGMFLNLNFIAAGAVSPSVFYLLAQGAVLLWIADRSRAGSTTDILEVVMMASATLAVISAPWIRTLAPAEVIDDPALMLSTIGGFGALCSFLTYHRLRQGLSQPA